MVLHILRGMSQPTKIQPETINGHRIIAETFRHIGSSLWLWVMTLKWLRHHKQANDDKHWPRVLLFSWKVARSIFGPVPRRTIVNSNLWLALVQWKKRLNILSSFNYGLHLLQSDFEPRASQTGLNFVTSQCILVCDRCNWAVGKWLCTMEVPLMVTLFWK